ncbi:hypothetical protein EYB53_013075 [Candidatus Chloroploca sp. M-50]|uniref:Uncharacterized protein n=1 Tax=Candidatus Chloroploca mongolica TaxID=2528176 RepID=A0ABS4DB14_9CHLR|nr:hypothetical protein [Candidatus Chloroploca mongolica]MBP1466641.1 hypothetical protein [Candidatus Chloroploca mongolica]
MKKQNWLGWLALGVAGLALMVALGGFFGGTMMRMRTMAYQQTAPQAGALVVPLEGSSMRGDHERGGPPAFVFERQQERNDAMRERMDRGDMRMEMGQMAHPSRDHGRFGIFGMFGMFLGLLNALSKMVALGLLAWLLLRLFQQRNANSGGTPPAPPLTPAGHDPRVE